MIRETSSWHELPHKDQLVVLALCRFSEPLSNTSALSYLYYMLAHFDKTLSAAEIARQAGLIAVSFALGQVLTGAAWGKASDVYGRKSVILIGLTGTACSALAFGFSQSYYQLIAIRFTAGLLNGNIGVLRTMIGEIVIEKRHQSRAFLILPMCFNIAISVSPMLAGLLADPTNSESALAWLLGRDSILGGASGAQWLRKYPYALPNILSFLFLSTAAICAWLFLDETLPQQQHRDLGRSLGRGIVRLAKRRHTPQYTSLPSIEQEQGVSLLEADARRPSEDSVQRSTTSEPLSYKQIFTTNVVLTLLNFMLSPLHNATFMQIFPLYLSTPISQDKIALPFHFNGGLGLSVAEVGYALSIIGIIGILMQIILYPRIQGRFGLIKCYRWSLCLFPLAYTLVPFLTVLRTYSSSTTISVWLSLGSLVLLQVIARTFALPSTVILLNNCAPSRDCLGFIHGIGSSLASLSRVIGPLSGAFLFAYGQDVGVVGLVWWTLATVAIFAAVFSHLIHEGPGLEVNKEQVS